MNANAYGGELARTLRWVEVVDGSGVQRRSPESLGFAYRRSNLGSGEVVARVGFELREGDPDELRSALAGLRARRKESQPYGVRTFGSTFKNPPADAVEGRTAGQLLDAAGCRGLRIGGAGLSDKHANFVINHGDATTGEVVEVMVEARNRVREMFGVDLEPEVQVFGDVSFPSNWWGAGR